MSSLYNEFYDTLGHAQNTILYKVSHNQNDTVTIQGSFLITSLKGFIGDVLRYVAVSPAPGEGYLLELRSYQNFTGTDPDTVVPYVDNVVFVNAFLTSNVILPASLNPAYSVVTAVTQRGIFLIPVDGNGNIVALAVDQGIKFELTLNSGDYFL